MEAIEVEFRVIDGSLEDHIACLNCGILKIFIDFFFDGCPNCESFLKFRNNVERIASCCTIHYQGIFILPEGYNSWKTIHKKVGSLKFGIYAANVFEEIPQHVLMEIEQEDMVENDGERGI